MYCLNRVGGVYNARVADDACADSPWPYPQGFPNYYTAFEKSLELLTSYGILGDVTVPAINQYGFEVQVRPTTGARGRRLRLRIVRFGV